MKVTKIMVWPSRTVSLGEFNSAKLSAGLEIEFEEPVDLESKEVKEAFEKARKVVQEEMKEQYKPYKEMILSRIGKVKL